MLNAQEKESTRGELSVPDVSDLAGLIEDISKLALTKLESRIYLHLLVNGASKASEISRVLDVNRIDIYRCLKSLRERGAVELIISRPLVFSAVEPSALRDVLVTEKEQELKSFKAHADKVEGKLERLPRYNKSSSVDPSNSRKLLRGMSTEQFTIKTGPRVTEKWQRMAENAQSEVLIILSRIGLMTHSREGFSDIYTKIKKKGVSVKMITDVSPENLEQAKEFSKISKIKVMHSVNDTLRYVVVDSSEAMISMGSFSNNQRDFAAILTTKPVLVKALRQDFEDRWRRAKKFPSQQHQMQKQP
ncbi:MAG: TrmB family transcriptional regulator [Nitrososphaerales archaeon]